MIEVSFFKIISLPSNSLILDYFVDIMNFVNFNGEFALKNEVGNCTNNQLDAVERSADTSLIKYCVCKDHYLYMDGSICPVDPFRQKSKFCESIELYIF